MRLDVKPSEEAQELQKRGAGPAAQPGIAFAQQLQVLSQHLVD